MSQTILKHSAFTNASLYVTCPKCDHEHKIGLVAFVHAINYGGAIECVACGNSFTIRLTRQPRAAELPLERTIQALEALCKLRDELRKSDYANWCGRVEMVIGLLDNA